MRGIKKILLTTLFLLSLLPVNGQNHKKDLSEFKGVADKLQSHLKNSAFVTGNIRLDSVFSYDTDIIFYFNNSLSEYPFRDESVRSVYDIVRSMTPQQYREKRLRIVSNGTIIEEFVPPLATEAKPLPDDSKRARKRKEVSPDNFVYNLSKPHIPTKGLINRHIALWQSHGYYYEQSLLRWEWQRARIFQTVEDLYTQSYVLPFLVPMLENAGATVMMPRERDFQTNEVICDFDMKNSGYSEISGEYKWDNSGIPGFAKSKDYYLSGENPFKEGYSRIVNTIKKGQESSAFWAAKVPVEGNYAVYISYQSVPNSTKNAIYKVLHSGGETIFRVNQTIGGGTWIYLGTFRFKADPSLEQGVLLSNITGENGEYITADAVKFGGGMGNIARGPSQGGIIPNRKSSSNEPLEVFIPSFNPDPVTSGYPRYTEGARYWLQWAGFNDSIYTPNQNSNDYNDDYMSRGKWVNVLSGGSAMNPGENGYKVPLDLAFAFHTDAGTTLNDSIVGTLGIYTRFSQGSTKYPDGSDRFVSRYLTDLIQTQIVEDIKYLHEPIWQRRGIWDRSYSESRSPVVPTMLLELLSHQNFADMRYGLDPQFRFDVSRSIYKGMLRFLSVKYGEPYIVQPLPVKNFTLNSDENSVSLQWEESIDPLEPTANANKYIVYTRLDDRAFDNGVITERPEFITQIKPGVIYSFKVAAVNDGGESFPSEILSVYNAPDPKGKVLIINGFDRVSAPASYASKDSLFAGFTDQYDSGVPYLYDISFIGSQYEYRRNIPWMDDDSPGFGASYANYESVAIAGNSFDYPFVHGKIFASLGYSFVSTSRDGLITDRIDSYDYDIVDLILGKQLQTKRGRGHSEVKYSTFTPSLMEYINTYSSKGGNILVSGSNVATDLWDSHTTDTTTQHFATNVLKYVWRTNQASRTGEVKAAKNPFGFDLSLSFYNEPNPVVYSAESPDGVGPAGANSFTIFRYSDNNISAGIAYKGKYNSVVLGFPIETVKDNAKMKDLVESIIKFFKQ